MTRFAAASCAVFAATLLLSATALAAKPSHQDMLNQHRSTSAGDPYVVDKPDDPRAECIAAGGTPKNQIQDNGTIAVTCRFAPAS